MTGGLVEATLELWASSLRDVKGRIRPLFRQERMASSAGLFLDALLGPERRKTGWMRAEAAGDPGPWRQQALLGRAQWDAEALRDLVRDYVVETLADRVAEICLSDRRVQTAKVRIEKLDVFSEAESVGVEIERQKEPLGRDSGVRNPR